MPLKLKSLLTSRKFWAAFCGLAVITVKVYRPDFPITAEQLTAFIVIVVGYIFGTAIESGLTARSGPQNSDQIAARSTYAQKQPK